jgi:hypothetical protein
MILGKAINVNNTTPNRVDNNSLSKSNLQETGNTYSEYCDQLTTYVKKYASMEDGDKKNAYGEELYTSIVYFIPGYDNLPYVDQEDAYKAKYTELYNKAFKNESDV